jgi:dolichol-phosphate mannosyltransferase
MRMVRARSISVVIPAYNEEGNLEGTIRDVIEAAQSLDDYEIIVVNDGSKDDTGVVAERMAAELDRVRVIHHNPNRGFAESYRTGLREARLEYFTFVPGDREVAPESIQSIFDAVGTADVVVPYHGTPWNRTWQRRVLTWICTTQLNTFFSRRLHYYQGPAVYPTALARTLPKTTTGFFFATEMLVHALALGQSWVEVPLIHHERAYGQSKAVQLSNIINAQLTIIRLWWNVRLRGTISTEQVLGDEPEPALPT